MPRRHRQTVDDAPLPKPIERALPPPCQAADGSGGRVLACLEALPLEVISLLFSQLSIISLHRLARGCRTFAAWVQAYDEIIVDMIDHPELRRRPEWAKSARYFPCITLHGYRLRRLLASRQHVNGLCFAWPPAVTDPRSDEYMEVPHSDLYEILLGPRGDLIEILVPQGLSSNPLPRAHLGALIGPP